jgi:DegV family protein with EDD domain
MRRVALITDSSACLPPEVVEGDDLRILPIVLHLPSGDIRGDTQLAAERVYRALAADEPVKSSAPSALEYLAAIEARDGGPVLVITPATEFTIMYRNACLAAELAGGPIIVLDSRTAAAAHGLVVHAAAKAAQAGASLEQIVRAAEDASRRAELVAALDRLEYIRRSGRVPSVALGFAEQLGIRPVFRLREGVVQRLGIARSEVAALRRIAKEAATRGFAGAASSAVFHAASPHRAEELRTMLGGSDFSCEFSPSMGIHTGPGVVGAAWLRAPST